MLDGKKINTIIFDEFNKEINKYEQTRKRVSNFYSNKNMSDKEIIEYLAEEIEQYRKKIIKQEEHIRELNNKTELKEIERIETDVKEIETINKFADGNLIETITKYKYKES